MIAVAGDPSLNFSRFLSRFFLSLGIYSTKAFNLQLVRLGILLKALKRRT